MLIWAAAALGVGAIALIGGWIYVTSTVEEPPFELVRKDGDFELRDYPPLVVAEVETSGSRGEAVREGFGPLANYIFAKDRPGAKIAMTAPVTQSREDEGWTVRFIMPFDRSMESLPSPAGDVRLRELEGGRRASVRFSGVADDELLSRQEARLRAWMDGNGLTPEGPPLYAYYNDPFTPGFLRRNEVMLEVAGDGAS